MLAAAMPAPSFAAPKAKAAGKASLCKRLQLSNESLVIFGDAWCELNRTRCSFTYHWAKHPKSSKIHLPVLCESDLKLELVGVHPIRCVNNWQLESMCLGD